MVSSSVLFVWSSRGVDTAVARPYLNFFTIRSIVINSIPSSTSAAAPCGRFEGGMMSRSGIRPRPLSTVYTSHWSGTSPDSLLWARVLVATGPSLFSRSASSRIRGEADNEERRGSRGTDRRSAISLSVSVRLGLMSISTSHVWQSTDRLSARTAELRHRLFYPVVALQHWCPQRGAFRGDGWCALIRHSTPARSS